MSRLPVAKLVLLSAAQILMAGCLNATASDDLASNSHVAAPPPPQPPVRPTFEGPILVGSAENRLPYLSVSGGVDNQSTNQELRVRSKEAFVDVSEDGQTMVSCAHGMILHGAFMYASTDGGTTWRQLQAEPSPPAATDCEVAISADGSAWAFIHSTAGLGGTVTVTRDQGKNWTVNPMVPYPVGGMADRPYIQYLGDRLLLAAQAMVAPAAITFWYSDDDGYTWSTPKLVALPERGETPRFSGFVLAPDGRTVRIAISITVDSVVFPTLEQAHDFEPRSFFAVSRDRGETWSNETVLTPQAVHSCPAAAEDGHGNLYWLFPREGEKTALLPDVPVNGLTTAPYSMWLTVSRDDGASWSEPVLVEDRLAWARPWAHGRPGSTADFLWQSADKPGETGLEWARFDADAMALHNTTILTVPNYVFEYSEITHDSNGDAYLVVMTKEQDPPRVHLYRESRPAAGG